jgi:hypothetical protein
LKIRNISSIFREAKETNILWKISEFYYVLDCLKNVNIDVGFWDNEENWAVIRYEDHAVAYVFFSYPIIICEKKYFNKITEKLKKFDYIKFITVQSLSSKELMIDNDLSIQLLNINMGKRVFSAEELWFETATYIYIYSYALRRKIKNLCLATLELANMISSLVGFRV